MKPIKIYKAGIHLGEEPLIDGNQASGMVSWAGEDAYLEYLVTPTGDFDHVVAAHPVTPDRTVPFTGTTLVGECGVVLLQLQATPTIEFPDSYGPIFNFTLDPATGELTAPGQFITSGVGPPDPVCE